MILSEIKNYLSERGSATLSDLSLHFDTPPDAMRGMLEQWVRKGKARKKEMGPRCSGCNHCSAASDEAYEWIDS